MSQKAPALGRRLAAGKLQGTTVTGHAYAVGQTVRFYPSALQSPGFGGLYVVVRQMPVEPGGPQYQVRCLDGSQQRVVAEAQLRGL